MERQEYKDGRTAFTRYLAKKIIKWIGWRVEHIRPHEPKYLVLAVPHTSNWDLPLMLVLSVIMGIRLRWAAKDTLFKPPFGFIFTWLGGIPVNRRIRTHFVDQMIDTFNNYDELIAVIAPEGTRSYAPHWKSGFYHIAHGANIPIAFGFLDYGNKVGGIVPGFKPTGDINADFDKIRAFYEGMKGKKPQNSGPIISKQIEKV